MWQRPQVLLLPLQLLLCTPVVAADVGGGERAEAAAAASGAAGRWLPAGHHLARSGGSDPAGHQRRQAA